MNDPLFCREAPPLAYGSDLWRFTVGQLVEVSGGGGGAGLSLAASFVRHAQTQVRPCLWLGTTAKPFYPPDMQTSGVDLQRLPLLFLSSPGEAVRACTRLLSCGGFELLVWDLASWKKPPLTLEVSSLARLNALARYHRSTVLILTDKQTAQPSLGSLIGLRLEAQADAGCPARLQVRVVKDKRGVVGESKTWVWRCDPPEGLADQDRLLRETLKTGRNSIG